MPDAVVAPGDQRVAARRLDQLQHGIVAERRIAVEIEPRRQAIEHAAGEDRDVDVRRLQAAFDMDLTQPEWALGYRFDIVLRGCNATPME